MTVTVDAGGLHVEGVTSQVDELSLETAGPFVGDCVCCN